MNGIDYSALYTGYPSDHGMAIEARGPAVEAYIAKRLAYALDLPSAPIEGGLSQWYTQNCSPLVNKGLSALNEGYAINPIETQRLVEQLWSLRYQLVHSPHSDVVDDVLSYLSLKEEGQLSYSLAPRYKASFSQQLPWTVTSTLDNLVASLRPGFNG